MNLFYTLKNFLLVRSEVIHKFGTDHLAKSTVNDFLKLHTVSCQFFELNSDVKYSSRLSSTHNSYRWYT